ncbi:MAG: hypothetical protein LBH70_04605 [Spirochaetaceae bacterium]|jgi:uncharacterized membrane protein YcgQ (UPF0703/DUF1980 family)|nr:hypothetical protein [Spirochaetaceae bacterium]
MNTYRTKLRLSRLARGIVSAAALLAVLAGCGSGGSGAAAQRNAAGTRSIASPRTGGQDSETADALSGDETPAPDGESVIEIKEKMFIAQTNDVYLNPEDYMGKIIKLEGLFKSTSVPGYDASYCFVIRYGPGCCGDDGSAGFEVAWDGDSPQYPEEDAWVEAAGVLKSYEEDGFPYLYLSLSSLEVKEERGAEFVAQ